MARCLLAALLLGGAAMPWSWAEEAWLDPEGRPLRFASLASLEAFLQTAAVIRVEPIGSGITFPRRLLLERDGRRLHAHFQSFDDVQEKARVGPSGLEFYFRDSYRFNVAAFRLARLLGMDNVPPSFFRRLRGERGAITVWLEGTFSERQRVEQKLQPPDRPRWSLQLARMRVFDELISNIDRNQGNILIDPQWKIWLIDHTRAFGRRKKLLAPSRLQRCERTLWRRLRSLSEPEIREAIGGSLTGAELKALRVRRRRLVDTLRQRIDELGEENVLFDLER